MKPVHVLTKQRGVTTSNVLLLLIVLAVVGLFANALGRVIAQDMKVNSIIAQIVKSLAPEARTDIQVLDSVQNEFARQNISLAPQHILNIRADSMFAVQKKYEVRRQLIGPIDIVIRFDKTFQP